MYRFECCSFLGSPVLILPWRHSDTLLGREVIAWEQLFIYESLLRPIYRVHDGSWPNHEKESSYFLWTMTFHWWIDQAEQIGSRVANISMWRFSKLVLQLKNKPNKAKPSLACNLNMLCWGIIGLICANLWVAERKVPVVSVLYCTWCLNYCSRKTNNCQ